MITSLLIVSLILGENDAGRGESKIASADERQQPRVKFAASLGVTSALAQQANSLGPAIRLEIGGVYKDRFGVTALLDVSSRIGVSAFMGGAAFMWAASDLVGLGLGVALSYVGATGWEEEAAAQALLIPLRVDLFFMGRAPHAVARSGVVVGLMVAPGLSRISRVGLPRRGAVEGAIGLAFLGGLTVGFALW